MYLFNFAYEDMCITDQFQCPPVTAEVDVGHSVKGLGRFRINVFQQRGTVSIAIRAIPSRILSFPDLFLPKVLEKIASEPRGMVLVTGTTGSGKSTTLASVINYINENMTRHIITIEDPIEYQIDGVNQIHVNPQIGLTFSAGLRHIVRQDPDVIMVGEIRDVETAEIAIQAALTGHLVFSTLHTNDAVSAVTRLVDMGIEPFLISSTVIGAIAQRLCRIICPQCNVKHDDGEEFCRECGKFLLSVEDPVPEEEKPRVKFLCPRCQVLYKKEIIARHAALY
jgi:pilus retraction protein PilT